MQLTLRAGLAAATAGLLGTSAGAQEEKHIDSAVLVYSEADRVSAIETAVSWKQKIGEDQSIRLKLVYDSLTGASANGAVPSRSVQTFTRPSGAGSYTVAPGETPLDDTFKDTRIAASFTYGRDLGRLTQITLGATGSSEYDYVSFGFNGGWSRDFNQRNTTLAAGASYAHDSISPEGGVPVAYAPMVASGADLPRVGDSDSKNVIDGILGITQVLNRSTIARFNYSLSRANGYLTDPFKLLSVVDGPTSVAAGDPIEHLYESRPDTRTKHSLYGEIRRHVAADDVLDVSYRYLWDSWELASHTAEARYRRRISERFHVQPRVRYYHQSAARFYRSFLVEGEALGEHASADYRIGTMDTITAGATIERALAGGHAVRLTAEYYSQLGERGPPEAFGTLSNLELNPTVDALMIRVGYSLDW